MEGEGERVETCEGASAVAGERAWKCVTRAAPSSSAAAANAAMMGRLRRLFNSARRLPSFFNSGKKSRERKNFPGKKIPANNLFLRIRGSSKETDENLQKS